MTKEKSDLVLKIAKLEEKLSEKISKKFELEVTIPEPLEKIVDEKDDDISVLTDILESKPEIEKVEKIFKLPKQSSFILNDRKSGRSELPALEDSTLTFITGKSRIRFFGNLNP